MAKIHYEFFDEYVKGTTMSGHSFIIDKDDYKFVSSVAWHYDKDGYFRNRNLGYMHRLINETSDGMMTDHINRDKQDNRKSNLRTVTASQNQENIGYKAEKGIYKNFNCNTWTATLNHLK